MGLGKGVAKRSSGGRVATGLKGRAKGSARYNTSKGTDIASSARNANSSPKGAAPRFSAWNRAGR